MSELPPQVQNMVAQLQQLQQQLQAVITQRAQVEALLRDTEDALKELNSVSDDTPIYKSVGGVLVKEDREKVIKELTEKKETYEIRLKTLQRQEEKLRERIAETQKKLQSLLSSGVQAG